MTKPPDLPFHQLRSAGRGLDIYDEVADEEKTGRIRCIGCGKFLPARARWNQCGDCDTRYPEEM